MPESSAVLRPPLLPPRAVGMGAAVITVAMWTAFIVIAHASAARSLTPPDLAAARIAGAALVLLPWGWWLVRQARATHPPAAPSSFFGQSRLAWRIAALALAGVFGAVTCAAFSYTGFTRMVGYFGTVRSTMITALVTGLPALGAVPFLGEPLSASLLLGLALVTAGILFGVRAIAAPPQSLSAVERFRA